MAKQRITLKIELEADTANWAIHLNGWKKESGVGLESAERSLRELAAKATSQSWGGYFLDD